MPSVLGGKRNAKVFILYLLQNIEIPVTYVTLNDMIMETEYVMYLDFAECFYELLDNELIVSVGEENGQTTYSVSAKGRMVAQQLHGDLLPVVLDESLKCALRYLDFKRRGVKTECGVRLNPDGSAEFNCSMTEAGRVICTATIHCDCLARAQQMENNFRERPEAVYKGMWALLSGNVNCLFS
ncbi:MAG: DUF4364 family protein [Clostridia bacterium]|nr:DUF4364 family protein [Clostridia bacterium]